MDTETVLSVEDLAPAQLEKCESGHAQGTIFGTDKELPKNELDKRIAEHADQMKRT